MRPGSAAGPRGDEPPAGGLGGLTRVLPPGLTGPSRRAAWQRTRVRRLLSAALAGTAVWLAVSAFLPQPVPRGRPVDVVAQDLMAGHVLTRGDLTVADWPVDLRPEGTVADPVTLIGRALTAGMSRGEAVASARLRGPGLLARVPDGLVAAHVRLADPAMATMAGPGDHVDLISSAGKLAVADVTVLAVDAGSADSGSWSAGAGAGPPGGMVVAVARDAAMRLATVEPSGLTDSTFSLVMRAPNT